MERVPPIGRPGFKLAATEGGGGGQGAAQASRVALGVQDSPNGQPISRPRPRAGGIWLETGGAGESYRVGYPDGHRDGGTCRAA